MLSLRLSRERTWRAVLPAVWVMFVLPAACKGREPEVFSTTLPADVPADNGPASIPASSHNVLHRIGIAPTPRNFPRHGSEDIRDMFVKSAELGSVAVLIYQWGDENYKQTATQLVKLARDAGLTPVVALSPTTLDQQRKELDIPAPLRGWFSKPTFKSKNVRKAFVADSEDLARLKLPYLCLATEINLLALQRMDEFLAFVDVYKEAYRAVHCVSPETKVFVSFQYEFVRILDNKEPGRLSEHAKVVDIFRPELDVLAITSYPAEFYPDPDAMPVNYYSHWGRYVKKGEEVMVMEIGWPSSGLGTSPEQTRFVERLPGLLSELNPNITAWALLHDVKLSAFGDNLATTGLFTPAGQGKEALAAFRRLVDRPTPTRAGP